MPKSIHVTALLALACAAAASHAQEGYDVAALHAYRAERERVLLADNGWFTVAGLHFLMPGPNRVGSDPSNDIVLAFPDVPARAVVVTLSGADAVVSAVDGGEIVYNGTAARGGPLRLAAAGRPADTVTFGAVSFFLHYSGPRLALRVRDRDAPLRTGFTGLRWYPPDPAFRVVGRFTPLAERRIVEAPNILGDLEPFTVAGTVRFTLDGRPHEMEAWRSGEQLWFVFRDPTSAETTYPSARFLYADVPRDGAVVLDFNYARNPPCAYNPWTTCPLPPPKNRLDVRIEAGEMRYADEPSRSGAR